VEAATFATAGHDGRRPSSDMGLTSSLAPLAGSPNRPGFRGRSPAASAGALPLTFFYGINNLRRSISGRPADLCRIVAKESTRSNRAVLQVIENKDQQSGDPLSPRQFAACFGSALFSSAYVSMRCGCPVAAGRIRLKLEAPNSYKIDYSLISNSTL
jgi:hypothetical protein